MARRRHLGAAECRISRAAARPTRARGAAERGDHGQPVGQDDRGEGPHGFDGGKKINGRKRHLLVDMQGLVLRATVPEAGITDRDGIKLLLSVSESLARVRDSHPGYSGTPPC